MLTQLMGFIGGNGVIASIITFLLGIGVVGVFLRKYALVAKEAAELINVVIDSIQDGKVNDAEIAAILKEYKDIPLAIQKMKDAKIRADNS